MFNSFKIRLFMMMLIVPLVIASCGGGTSTEQTTSQIETAVAATVASQNTATQSASTALATEPAFTATALVFSPTLTPMAVSATATQGMSTSQSQCASASLVGENSNEVPDGKIFKPGTKFTKTWEIKNTSPCTWDTTYKILFWNGDLLGGAYYYNLPQAVAPGQIVPISLQLVAPSAEALYKSEWVLQTPDGVSFGVGQYSSPFYTSIQVSSSTSGEIYSINATDFSITRDPPTGCPANVNYIVTATLVTNGPIEYSYQWLQSDGNDSSVKTKVVKSATTFTLTREWKLHITANTGTRWFKLVIVEPVYKEYPPVEFTKTCGG